jgi:hypothetical protein
MQGQEHLGLFLGRILAFRRLFLRIRLCAEDHRESGQQSRQT